MKTGTLKKSLLNKFGGSFRAVIPIAAALNAAACGSGSLTITNLPPLTLGGYQPYALNAGGEVTGFFYNSAHAPHAFIYNAGALADLGTLGGATSIGYAINSAGQVAGQADLVSGTHAVLYSGGTNNDLGTLGGSSSSASALNEAGQVVGESLLKGDVGPIAFLYTSGPMVSLGTLGSNYSSAFAINNNGVVIGESGVASGDVHGFIYSGGQIADVGTLGGTYSSAFALNDSGLVVGESFIASGDTHAFTYFQGTISDLGTLGGTYSTAFAVNTNGQIAGVANTTADQETHGFLYDHGTMTDLGTLGGNYSSVWALNNRGQVVGNSGLPDGTQHAFLWDNGNMTDLNTLLPPNSGWELVSAQFINDAGRIVGYGNYGGAYPVWFVMDPAIGNNPPVANAGPNQTVDCQAQVTLNGSGSSDPDNDPLTYAWTMGGSALGTTAVVTTSLPLGTNVVTLMVTDTCGASNQANVIVTVVDTTPPTGSCPSDMTAPSDANCLAPVPDVVSQVTASDNCTPTTSLNITQDPAAGTMVGLGAHPISVKVTDSSGNSSHCSVTFTVADQTPPTILSVPAPLTVSAGDNCQGVVPNVLSNVVAMDNCTPANQIGLSQNPTAGAFLGTGQYTIVVTAMDASGNTSTGSVQLTVADTTPPTILSMPASVTVSAGANCQGTVPNVLSNVVAMDNCTSPDQLLMSQNPTAGTALGSGQSTIVVTVTDLSGNYSTGNVGLTIADMTPPTLSNLPGPITLSADANCQAVVPNVLANLGVADNCTPTSQVVLSQSPAASSVLSSGQYTISITATDLAGNVASATVALSIVGNAPPVIQSLTATPNLLSPPNHELVPVNVSALVSGGCDSSLVTKITSITANEALAPGDVQITGNLTCILAASRNGTGNGRVYTITVQSTDNSGNSSTATVSVVVPKGNSTGGVIANVVGNGKK